MVVSVFVYYNSGVINKNYMVFCDPALFMEKEQNVSSMVVYVRLISRLNLQNRNELSQYGRSLN
jgi:hypothetical protein